MVFVFVCEMMNVMRVDVCQRFNYVCTHELNAKPNCATGGIFVYGEMRAVYKKGCRAGRVSLNGETVHTCPMAAVFTDAVTVR